jgi:hypothetical protein
MIPCGPHLKSWTFPSVSMRPRGRA